MTRKMFLMAALAVLAGAMVSMAAESLDAVKARMAARKSDVQALLAGGSAGEGFAGYLVELGKVSAANIELVKAENADRKTVYEAIAGKHGTSAEQVGRQRAATIAEKAPSGTMLQSADGKWTKKP